MRSYLYLAFNLVSFDFIDIFHPIGAVMIFRHCAQRESMFSGQYPAVHLIG